MHSKVITALAASALLHGAVLANSPAGPANPQGAQPQNQVGQFDPHNQQEDRSYGGVAGQSQPGESQGQGAEQSDNETPSSPGAQQPAPGRRPGESRREYKHRHRKHRHHHDGANPSGNGNQGRQPGGDHHGSYSGHQDRVSPPSPPPPPPSPAGSPSGQLGRRAPRGGEAFPFPMENKVPVGHFNQRNHVGGHHDHHGRHGDAKHSHDSKQGGAVDGYSSPVSPGSPFSVSPSSPSSSASSPA